ncbi:DesA family fatty acid desaturase [Ramlibacter sp.]|uniref:DesA family fatty acid desaturase n=1 Tax=Ramlibacter sp. TaxID=1917967 RepID=UPI002FCA99DA
MMLPDWPLLNAVLDWLANGMWHLFWWQIVLYTLATTHITIASVTIFLHRSQAHRALDLHPIPSHFLRFWLWLGTGMVTKEWVAIHRKHHAKCEGGDDPHSPQTRGLETVLWRGAELYRTEAKNKETLTKYGQGTRNDWIERNLYSRYTWQGVGLMLILNLVLFGALGLTVWAVQMIWIPLTAAGVVNGIGHFWGYRNFETTDASTNISPWGLIIGGEELHNNHHTYPTSAKFSVHKYEFDLGWVYISLLRRIGWATVKKVPPKMRLGAIREVPDDKTLEALIANRYELMATYASEMKRVCKAEIAGLKARQPDFSALKSAKRWVHRDEERVPVLVRSQLAVARAAYPEIDKMLAMREELRQMWLNTSRSREQLAADLQSWCRRAEESGIVVLQQFSMRLRSAHA